jgi:hypothetical protein
VKNNIFLIFGTFCLFLWFLFTFRIEVIIFIIFAIFISFKKSWRESSRNQVLVFIMGFLVAFSPLGLTLASSEKSPRIVDSCWNHGQRLSREGLAFAKSALKKGLCYPGTDLITGFEPKWYLIW